MHCWCPSFCSTMQHASLLLQEARLTSLSVQKVLWGESKSADLFWKKLWYIPAWCSRYPNSPPQLGVRVGTELPQDLWLLISSTTYNRFLGTAEVIEKLGCIPSLPLAELANHVASVTFMYLARQSPPQLPCAGFAVICIASWLPPHACMYSRCLSQNGVYFSTVIKFCYFKDVWLGIRSYNFF